MDFHGIRLPDKEEITIPGKKLSQGEHANVFEWGKDKVIKIFKASYPMELIDAEYYNALAVKQLPFKKSIPPSGMASTNSNFVDLIFSILKKVSRCCGPILVITP